MGKDIFNINNVLENIFFSLEKDCKTKNIELIYNMCKTLPKELRGNAKEIESLLVQVLNKIFHTCENVEIVLSIKAPEDFLYEETVSFVISHIPFKSSNLCKDIQKNLEKEIKNLHASLDDVAEDSIEIGIPLSIGELGFRRHYRLPSKSLLQKNILLIIESQNVTLSITRMFKYFPYNVDISFRKYREDKYVLSEYDVVVIEDKLIEDKFLEVVRSAKEQKSLKLVILRMEDINYTLNDASAFLNKPITQERIFELMVSLFLDTDNISEEKDRRSQARDYDSFVSKEEIKKHYFEILDKTVGMSNAKKKGNTYSDVLLEFLDIFQGSDLYLRELVNEKSYDKIQEFSRELKKDAEYIGAQSMYHFVEKLEDVFTYKKYDQLVIYPGRYHMELKKLFGDIKKYLHIS